MDVRPPERHAAAAAARALDLIRSGRDRDADRLIRTAAHSSTTPVELALAFYHLGASQPAQP